MKISPRFNKPCPFCPKVKYGYRYKTWCGLLRHVHSEHLGVLSKRGGYSYSWNMQKQIWKTGDVMYIRIYETFPLKYHDLDIKSPEECEKLLMDYVTDNPSFRGFIKKS